MQFTPLVKVAVIVALLACISFVVQARTPALSRRERIVLKRLERLFDELSDDLDVPSVSTDACPPPLTRKDEDVNAFLTKIQSFACLDQKLVEFDSYLSSSAVMFTSNQASRIIETFSKFSFVKKHVSSQLLIRMAELKGQEVINLMKLVTDSTLERLNILDKIKSNIADLKVTRSAIVSALFDATSQPKATAILSQVSDQPHDCIFGSISGNNVIFTIDVSPSMGVPISTGSKVSRFSFVREHLISSLRSLKPTQNFNVIFFCGKTVQMFPQFTPVTEDAIQKVVEYTKNGLSCSATDISLALKSSYEKYDKLVGSLGNEVFFLSDGVPSSGVTDTTKLIALAKQMAENNPHVRINTISFNLGNGVKGTNLYESPTDKENAALVLSSVAQVSGGVFKRVQESA